jgi:hypothetical protein
MGLKENELETIKKIHDMFPHSRFVYFDQQEEIPIIQDDWLSTYHVQKGYMKGSEQRLSLLKRALQTDIYNEKDKQLLQTRLDRIIEAELKKLDTSTLNI